MIILTIIATIAALVAINECLRRWPVLVWVVFGGTLIAFIPYELIIGITRPFTALKLFSVAFSILWFAALAQTNLKKHQWAKQVIWWLLAINIGEAVVRDAMNLTSFSVVNALSGVLLIFTIPSAKQITIETKHGGTDVAWNNLSWAWIILYTLWNILFVYFNFTGFVVRHVGVLVSPLVAALVTRGTWIQSRLYTLGSYLIVGVLFYTPLLALNVSETIDSSFAIMGSSITFGMTLAHALCQLYKKQFLR